MMIQSWKPTFSPQELYFKYQYSIPGFLSKIFTCLFSGHVPSDTLEAFHRNATSTSEEDGHLGSNLRNIRSLGKVIQDLTKMDCLWKLGATMVAEHMEYKEGREVHIITIRHILYEITINDPMNQLTSELLDGDKQLYIKERKPQKAFIGRLTWMKYRRFKLCCIFHSSHSGLFNSAKGF